MGGTHLVLGELAPKECMFKCMFTVQGLGVGGGGDGDGNTKSVSVP